MQATTRSMFHLALIIAGLGGSADAQEPAGWFQHPQRGSALVVPAAHGGYRMLDPGPSYWAEDWLPTDEQGVYRRQAFHRVDDGRWQVRFDDEHDRWEWTDDSGRSHRALRSDGPYRVQELHYQHDEVALTANLFLPAGTPPFPLAAILHGSGNSDRDNLWYMQIVHRLAVAGIAVLFPDKRGSGESGGDWRSATLQELADDVAAGLDAVAEHPEIDSGKSGVVGISQGGHIAPMLAVARPDLAFVVNLVGGAVPLNESLRHETLQTLQNEHGMSESAARAMLPAAIGIAKARKPTFWWNNGDTHPIDYWARTDAPSLVIYGSDDERDNVPVQNSVERLKALNARRPAGSISLHVFDGLGHDLRQNGEHMIDERVFETLMAFLRQATREHAAQAAPQ